MPRQYDDGRALFSRLARMRGPSPVSWGRPPARHHASGRDVDSEHLNWLNPVSAWTFQLQIWPDPRASLPMWPGPGTFKLGESGSGMNISDTDLAGPGNFFANEAGPGTFKLGGSGCGMNISDIQIWPDPKTSLPGRHFGSGFGQTRYLSGLLVPGPEESRFRSILYLSFLKDKTRTV